MTNGVTQISGKPHRQLIEAKRVNISMRNTLVTPTAAGYGLTADRNDGRSTHVNSNSDVGSVANDCYSKIIPNKMAYTGWVAGNGDPIINTSLGYKQTTPYTTFDPETSQSLYLLERQPSLEVSDDNESRDIDDVTSTNASSASNDELTKKTRKKKSSKKKKKSSSSMIESVKWTVDGDRAVGGGKGARPKTIPLNNMTNTVRNMGYSELEVSTALDRLREADTEVTYDSLIDVAYDVRNELVENEAAPAGTPEFRNENTVMLDDTEQEIVEDTITTERHAEFKAAIEKALQHKKDTFREAIAGLSYKCRVCGEADANILLLPCSHLVCCSDCLYSIRRCPLPRCGKVVRGTKEVFFA